MDYFNPDDWTKLETAFTSAPPWASIVAAGAASGLLGWWVRGKMSETQISVKEERLKFAVEQTASVERDFEKLEKEFQDYKAEVAAKGRNASPAKVDAAIVRVTNGNTVIRDKLFDALMSRENAKNR
jgi:hypothetical protein